jgi:tetratricopeptide (TPR) repeat protein
VCSRAALIAALGLAAVSSGAFAQEPTGLPAGLPALDCVRALRSARIARMLEQPAVELERLQQGREPCAENLGWLQAMLDYERRVPLSPAAHDELHDVLLRRLAEPLTQVPEPVINHLVYEPDLAPELRDAVIGAFERQVAGQEAPSLLALRALAHMFLEDEREAEAALVLERLATVDAGETSDWQLASLYQGLERWNDAARVLRRIMSRGPLQTRLLQQRLIEVLLQAGDDRAALREVTALAEGPAAGSGEQESPVTADVFLELAWRFRDATLDAEAEQLFRRALEMPERTAAILALEQGAAPSPLASREASLALAHLYTDGEERKELLERASGSSDSAEDPFALYELGSQQLTSGETEAAFLLLSRAAPELPELEAAWFNLALAAYRLKRWQEAADAYQRACELNSERADSWFFLGMAWVNLERCSEAVEPLETALRLDPSRSLAHYHLASCYDRLDRPDAANEHRRAYQEARDDAR